MLVRNRVQMFNPKNSASIKAKVPRLGRRRSLESIEGRGSCFSPICVTLVLILIAVWLMRHAHDSYKVSMQTDLPLTQLFTSLKMIKYDIRCLRLKLIKIV